MPEGARPDDAALPSAAPPREPGPLPAAVATLAVGAGLVAGLGAAVAEAAALGLPLMLHLVGSMVVLAGLGSHAHAQFGPANAVTALRLALVCVLVATLREARDPAFAWGAPMIAAVALALDGVDGWLARRTGLVSRFGARFDLEVDCLLALALAVAALGTGKVGAWVLALGLARYAFWAASAALPWLAAPLPERRSRKVVCVAQIAALIAILTPVVAAPLAGAIAAAALAGVAWSFAVDVRWLAARPRR